MTIRIYGASDDLIEVEGCENADEFNSYEHGLMWRGDLRSADGAMRVHAVLDNDNGCWSFAVGAVAEDLSLPSWPVRITDHPETAYTVLLEIDAPDGTVLENVWPTRDEDDA